MASRHVIIGAGLVVVLSAPELQASCVCVGSALEERIEAAAAVFIGTALDQTETSNARRGTLLETTFLIGKSWKGPGQDIVEVRSFLMGDCGAHYVVGETYLVIAFRDAYGLQQLDCVSAIKANRAQPALVLLGNAIWVAPPAGQREIDASVLRPEDLSVPAEEGGIMLQGVVMDHDWHAVPGVRIEMSGGRVATSGGDGAFVMGGFQPGLYLARLVLPDGSVNESYAKIRCGQFHRSGCSSFLRYFFVSYVAPPVVDPGPRAEAAGLRDSGPLDSLQAVELLREAASSLEMATTLRHDDAFKGNLRDLFTAWGAVPPALLSDTEVIDSLLQAGRSDEAVALAGAQGRTEQWWYLAILLERLAQHGEWERALVLSDSLEWLPRGVGAVLRASWPDSSSWKVKVEKVGEFLGQTRDGGDLEYAWDELLLYLGKHDLEAAWALAGRRLPPVPRMEARLQLLDEADTRKSPAPDSMLLQAHGEIMRLSNAQDRTELLDSLGDLCEMRDPEVCAGLDLPVIDHRNSPQPEESVAGRLSTALKAGHFAEARARGDTLRELVTPERYAIEVAKGLWGTTGPCLLLNECAQAYESEVMRLLPTLDQAAVDAEDADSDSLNAYLAGLWAPRDPERAWRALARIASEEAKSVGLERIASAVFDTDFEMAFEALRKRGTASWMWIYLLPTYVDFKSRGDEERARETLALVDQGVDRMEMKLEWAREVERERRLAEARQLALAALEEWDPETDTMQGSIGQFGLFERLEVFEDLIRWARERQDPDDRAAALAAVVGSVTSPR